MDREEILKLARKTGIRFHITGSPSVEITTWNGLEDELLTFANAVAAQERKECAKICDELSEGHSPTWHAEECASAIRSRGNK